MEDITMEDITKVAKDNKAKDSSPSSIDAVLTDESYWNDDLVYILEWAINDNKAKDSSPSSSYWNEELSSHLLLPDFDASTEAPTIRTSTPPPSIMNGSFVPSTPQPGALSAHMGESLALSMEAMSLSNSIGTFSVTHVPSNSSFDLRSTFSVKTSPLYPSSICQHSPATTLSSLQSTPSTLPSLHNTPTCTLPPLNNTPTLQQIQSNGTMPSSSSTSWDTQLFHDSQSLRRAQIFKSLPSELDTSFTRMLSTRTPTEKVLLLDQEQVSEWDIVVNPNGHVSDINEGSRRFHQLVKAMATPYSEQSERKFKTSLSMAVVEFVRAYGGRFVDMDDSGWYTLTKAKAREKTSQALREMKPSMLTKVEGTELWKAANVTHIELMLMMMSEGSIHIDGKPGKWDVIGGRGGGANHHEGNRRYRGLIEQFKVPYNYEREECHEGRMRKRKELLSSAIFDYVKCNGGRFVEIRNHQNLDGSWAFDVSEVVEAELILECMLQRETKLTKH
jgi:hypothetical protein